MRLLCVFLTCGAALSVAACVERAPAHDQVLTEVEAVAAPAEPRRPQTPTGQFPYRVESYTWGEDPTLAGTLTLPGGDGPFPAVVLISGSGPQDRDETIMGHKPFWVIADHLTRHGIGVLRVDDRGVGKSTGDLKTITLDTNADDVRSNLAWLRGRADIDTTRIGLIGHSEGGLLAAMVAAGDPDVAFVVSLAGTGVPGDRIIMDQFDTMMAADPALSPETLASARQGQRKILDRVIAGASKAELKPEVIALITTVAPGGANPFVVEAQVSALSSPWYRAFVSHDPAKDWQRVKAPVLVLNGTLDTQVRASLNVPVIANALKAAGNTAVTIDIREGLNHLFQPAKTGSIMEYRVIETTFDLATLERMTSWIQARTAKRD